MVLAFVAAAGLGWVARGVTLNSADAAPAVAHKPAACPNPEAIAAVAALTTPPPAEPEEAPAADDDVTPDPDDENSGDDVGDILAKAHDATVSHNGVHGVVTDQASGAPLASVTVLLVLPTGGAQTAVTNEEGEYSFTDIEAGTYTVSFYYINSVAEHPNVTVNSFDSVLVSERMDSNQPYRHHYDEEDGEYIFEME